jgi:hypothetical protein
MDVSEVSPWSREIVTRRGFFRTLLSVGTVAVLAPVRLCTACVEKVRVRWKSVWWKMPKGAKSVKVTLIGGGGGGGSGRGGERGPVGLPGRVEIESTLEDGSTVTQMFEGNREEN